MGEKTFVVTPSPCHPLTPSLHSDRGKESRTEAEALDFLLVSIGSHGDVHPFAGLGSVLRSRGHRVSASANPHFKPLIRKCGLEFIGVRTDEEYRRLARNPDLWNGRKATEVIIAATAQMTRQLFDLVARRVVPNQTVVIGSSLAFGARIAQDKL